MWCSFFAKLLNSWYCHNQKQSSRSVLQKRCSYEFSKTEKKTPASGASFLMKLHIYRVYFYRKKGFRHRCFLKSRLEDVLKTSWKRLEDVLKTSWKRPEDVLKTYGQYEYIGLDQDVLKTSWRRKAKAHIFVLIKTSSSRRMFAGYKEELLAIV